MKDGIYPALPRDGYDVIERINISRLQVIERSPLHYKDALGAETEDSDAKLIGRVAHGLVLEPHRFKDTVAVWRGADDASQIGAYHLLYETQGVANYRSRLHEYLPFNLEAGIFLIPSRPEPPQLRSLARDQKEAPLR